MESCPTGVAFNSRSSLVMMASKVLTRSSKAWVCWVAAWRARSLLLPNLFQMPRVLMLAPRMTARGRRTPLPVMATRGMQMPSIPVAKAQMDEVALILAFCSAVVQSSGGCWFMV